MELGAFFFGASMGYALAVWINWPAIKRGIGGE